MDNRVRTFFDTYLDAWNAHDSAAVARHMADDAVYEDVALGRVLQLAAMPPPASPPHP